MAETHSYPTSVFAPKREALAKQLFSFLAEEGVSYVVVGDSRSYNRVVDSDIDVVVAKEAVPRLLKIINRFSEATKGSLVQVLQHEAEAWYFVLAYREGSSISYLQPDICSSYIRDGRLYIDAEELLYERMLSPLGFYVPSTAAAFGYYIVKKIHKGHVDGSAFSYLRSLVLEDSAGCHDWLRRFWTPSQAMKVLHALEHGAHDALVKILPTLRSMLISKGLMRPLCQLREYSRVIRRLAQPTGLHIAVGGNNSSMDALAIRLEETLAPAFRRTLIVDKEDCVVSASRQVAQSAGILDASRKTHFLERHNVLRLQLDAAQNVLIMWRRLIASTLVISLAKSSALRAHHSGSADLCLPLMRSYRIGLPWPAIFVMFDLRDEGAATIFRRNLGRLPALAMRRLDSGMVRTRCTHDDALEAVVQEVLEHLRSRTKSRYGLH